MDDYDHLFDDIEKNIIKVAFKRTNYKALLTHDRETITVNGKTFKLTISSTRRRDKRGRFINVGLYVNFYTYHQKYIITIRIRSHMPYIRNKLILVHHKNVHFSRLYESPGYRSMEIIMPNTQLEAICSFTTVTV